MIRDWFLTTKKFIKHNWQMLLNIYIFINIAGYGVWQGVKTFEEGRLDFVELSFIAQNIVMLTFILIRHKHHSVNSNIFHQIVALFAFFSGLLFIGQEPSGGILANSVSSIIIFISNILGIITLLNLGKSFGILIALRKVKTGGLYSVVRHPMYGTDILLRIGFLVSHFNSLTVILFLISSGAYVTRAIFEENFLLKDPKYREYVKKVKYRFIPLVF